MTTVAVATTSQLAADAAAELAEAGGNAVDCAVAAAMLSCNTEPGVCALAGGAYVTIWPTDARPVTIDGNVAVPGFRMPQGALQAESVHMEYGGGVTTLVGPVAVAVPGTLAALELASNKYGRVRWRKLLEPSVRATRNGFPLSAACHHYLQYSGDAIFGRSRDGYSALHDEQGKLHDPKSNIVVPHLADSLEAIAAEGSRIFYQGEIGSKISQHVQQLGGLLSAQDLQRYEAIIRPSLTTDLGDWQIAANPPPAVGGAVLCAMLIACNRQPIRAWNQQSIRRLIRVQQAALSYRKSSLDLADDVAAEVRQMLAKAHAGQLPGAAQSSSTVHTSAVDDSGLACAITASSGYGSGEMPHNTGLWLNNCLGELELNRRGLDAGPPGARLPSNMAPGAARNGKRVLAMGSPGADRITTALLQFLINFVQLGLELEDAVAHPRLHLELNEWPGRIAVEPGLPIPDIGLPVKSYPEIGMYFGGVGAVLRNADGSFQVAADPRREGGTCIAKG